MPYANYDDVVSQLVSVGLIIDHALELANGKRSIRCRIDGEDREKRGWYRLHEWQIEPGTILLVGSFGIFRGSKSETFKIELTKKCEKCCADVGLKLKSCPSCGTSIFKKREFTEDQKSAFKERIAEDKKRAAAERATEIDRASKWATAVWRASKAVSNDGHQYLTRKQLMSDGGSRVFTGNDGVILEDADQDDYQYLNTFTGCLTVPMCDETGRVFGLQFIAPQKNPKTGRDKTYWPRGMSAESHYWLIGGSIKRICLVAEGFATAMTLHQATGHPVAVAFSAGNILPVAKSINKRTNRRAKILLCADDDFVQKCQNCQKYTPVAEPTCSHCGKPHGQTNTGLSRCQESTLALDNAAEFIPVFTTERPTDKKGPTDFNDLAVSEGVQLVTAQFEQRIAALGWETLATTQTSVTNLSRAAGEPQQGGGDALRQAVSVMQLDDAVERFVPLDDGTGEYVFDTWTKKIAKKSQMITLLPAGVRGDDIKRHNLWVSRGAYYLEQVGFDPTGKDKTVKLNTWRGWPMQPKSGCCEELLNLINYLCGGEEKRELYDWLLGWMAYPLQNPGAKMNSAVIMHGPQGTGKSTVFKTLSKIYGNYATVLNQRGLEDKFNSDWSDSKLFILAEEVVTRQEMWHIKNELKELVTGEWIRVNPKNVAAYTQKNQVNLVFLSNENQPLPLDNDDRRHCVIYTPPALPNEFYDKVNEELRDGGVEAFYHHLLHLDLSGFDFTKRPPHTEAKTDLIELSLPSEIRFINDWVTGELGMPIIPCLSADLYAMYLRWCRTNGESRPRPSNIFHGAVSHLSGWKKERTRIYSSASSLNSEPKNITTPSDAALKYAETEKPIDIEKIRWITDCCAKFHNEMGKTDTERGGI